MFSLHPIAKRTVTALTTAAVVTALFAWCPIPVFFPLLLVLSTLVQLEFYQMAKAYEPATVLGLALGAIWLAATAAYAGPLGACVLNAHLPVVMTAVFALVVLRSLFCGRCTRPVGSAAVTLLGIFYVPFLLSFYLRFMQAGAAGFFVTPPHRTGLYTLLAVIAVTKLSDMGGFAFGLAFGRHKMCPSVSPKKSWEGFAGSVLGSCLMAALFCRLAQVFGWAADVPMWKYVTYPVALAAGAVIATVATLGDLVESRFKRECGVKDSATFMPAGLGGFLDMFDSVLAVPALVYPFLLFLQGA